MMNSAKTPASKFVNAVDFFFGHNPANPYWALVALTLRKKHLLAIVEDFEGPACNKLDISASMYNEAVSNKHVVALGEKNEVIQNALSIFRHNMVVENNSISIFDKAQWEREFLLEFADALIELDEDWLQANFNKCYAILVLRAFARSRFEEYGQPGQLSRLVRFIGKYIAPYAKLVLSPFAGLASYAIDLPQECRFIGEEINPLIAAIANLRLYANGVNGEVKAVDSVNANPYKADLVVSTPPFAQHLQSFPVEIFGLPKEKLINSDELVIRKCILESLPGIIVVPQSINTRANSTRQLRRDLIKSGSLDMIISLPSGIFNGTEVATAIFVLNPHHDHPGSVRFINGAKSFEINELSNNSKFLDWEGIVFSIKNGGDKSKLVYFEDIVANDFNLSPEIYFADDIHVPEGMKLLKVFELGKVVNQRPQNKYLEVVTDQGEITWQRIADVPVEGKLVNFGVLKNPNPIKVYQPSDFDERELPSRPLKIVNSGLLFFGGRGVMGVCIQAEGDTLYTHADYINFIPDEKIILPQYLLIQFQESYVADQLLSIPAQRMKADILENIRVLVPSLEEQRKAIQEYQGRLIAKMGLDASDLRTAQYNEFEKNMHLRKHALKQILNEVVPGARRIAKFISSQEGYFSGASVIAERSGATLEDYTAKLYQNVLRIQDLISSLTDETKFEDAQTFDFHRFIAQYRQQKFTNERYSMTFFGHGSFFEEPIESEIAALQNGQFIQAPELTVHIAPKALATVFDNIITNAAKYGFTDEKRQDYSIRVDFSNVMNEDRPMLEITVKNNGASLPAGMTPDRIFKWGVGTGTGLGTWQAKNIVEHYGGSIEFNQLEDAPDGYNIVYRILLPMTE